MNFTLMALGPRGQDLCILDLLHGCDNMVNQLAKKAKVLVQSMFLIMVLFEMSSRLNYISITFKPNVLFSNSAWEYCSPWR